MKKMLCIQSSKTFNKYSFVYLFTYLILLSFSIIKYSNLIYVLKISSLSNLLFNIIIFLVLFVNVFLLFICNPFKKCVMPLLIIFISIIFLFFDVRLIPLSFLVIYLMCCNARLLNINKFSKYNFLAILIPFLFIIILHLINFIPDIVINYAGAYKGNSLGFVHPNDTGAIVIGLISAIYIIFNWMYTTRRIKSNIFSMFIIGLIITIVFYYITNCRELLYFGAILSFFVLFTKLPLIKSIIYMILIPIIICIPSLLIYFDYNYNPASPFYLNINSWLSSRIFMQNKIIYNYPITFIRKIKDAPVTNGLENTITLDNSFLSILEICGIVGLIIVSIFLIKLMLMGISINSYISCILLLSLIVCSCVESSLFTIYLNGPLLYLVALYQQSNSFKCNNKYINRRHIKRSLYNE